VNGGDLDSSYKAWTNVRDNAASTAIKFAPISQMEKMGARQAARTVFSDQDKRFDDFKVNKNVLADNLTAGAAFLRSA
jgi:hypothetical protein